MIPRVKICGLTRSEDARHAERLGADLLGFILSEGFSRTVSTRRAKDVVEGTAVERVAVFVDEKPDVAATRAALIGASVVQLHGDEPRAVIEELKRAGSWQVWKAVRARSFDDVSRVVDAAGDLLDGILVEGWREGVSGGGGVRVLLDPVEVRGRVPAPLTFVLAGGLTPDSVGDAVARFSPDIVDVSSGVERVVGRKDSGLIESFLRSARDVQPKPTSGL